MVDDCTKKATLLFLACAIGGKNCLRAKTAHGSIHSYVAFVPDELFCFGGIQTNSNNLLPKLVLKPWSPSIP